MRHAEPISFCLLEAGKDSLPGANARCFSNQVRNGLELAVGSGIDGVGVVQSVGIEYQKSAAG